MGFTLQCCVSSLLLMLTVAAAVQQVPHEEMTALSALHNSTRGDTWRWQDERVAGAVWNFTITVLVNLRITRAAAQQ